VVTALWQTWPVFGQNWFQLITVVLTAVSSLGGVALGGWLGSRRERTQWTREQQHRQLELRRNTCAEFVATATECRRLLAQLFYFQQARRDREILATGDEFNERNRDLHRRAAYVRLVASPELAAAADEVIVATTPAIQAIKATAPVDSPIQAKPTLPELEVLNDLIGAFIARARLEQAP
jgi:hypothetical protein